MTRKQWEDYNSRKEQLVIDGLFAQIAEQRMGTKRFLDDMDSIDKLTKERNRLREALQLLYDTSDATPGTAQWEDYELALRRAEAALKEVGDD